MGHFFWAILIYAACTGVILLFLIDLQDYKKSDISLH